MGDKRVEYVCITRSTRESQREGGRRRLDDEGARACEEWWKCADGWCADGVCAAGGFLRNWIGAEDDGGAVDGDVGVSSERRTNHRFGGVCVGVGDVAGGEEIEG